MTNYAKADRKAQWFQDDFPGADLNLSPDTMVLVLHTTETMGWPGYGSGESAPTYTHLPSLAGKSGDWRAHFPDEKSARALRNEAGGVETNTLNCVQVELIGTCDTAKRRKWVVNGRTYKAGIDYVYWPDATAVQLWNVAAFLADMNKRHGLKLTAPRFLPYPASYGASLVRMSFAQWRRFAGVCGHQHVPENTHGDPGDIAIDRILELAKAMVEVVPEPKVQLVKAAHISLQHSDSAVEVKMDLKRIFNRAKVQGYGWLTGTESSRAPVTGSLADACEEHGFKLWNPDGTDSWIAVNEDFTPGALWNTYLGDVIPAVKGKHSGRGVTGVTFDTGSIGQVTVLTSHYLIHGSPVSDKRWNLEENKKLAQAIGSIAKQRGAGKALCFYGGDQNIVDRRADTFFAEPLTSVWDELKKWPDTGHGNIDVVASYNGDGRVAASYGRVLDDQKFPLHTDHYLIEAGFTVRPLS